MRKLCTAVALSAALLIPSAISAADHNKRVVVYFDRDNRDRHEWNEREERAYRHWLEQERRARYHNWRKANRREQQEYWRWRHANPDWR